MKFNFKIFFGFLIASILLFGCSSGCMVEGASNYDPDAVNEGYCAYEPCTLSFYTNTTLGGNIHVELSNPSLNTDPFFYYWNSTNDFEQRSSVDFNRDEEDPYYPLCKASNLGRFYRIANNTLYYDAFDEIGNTWSGAVELKPHECRLIELKRGITQGDILIYSGNLMNSDFNVTIDQGSSNEKTILCYRNELYEPNTPSCNGTTGVRTKSNLGAVQVKMRENVSPYTERTVVVQVVQGTCTMINISDHF